MKSTTTTVTSYWIATLLLSADMAFAAFSYFSRDVKIMAAFASLGYPAYFPLILGTAKILGIVALLVPGQLRLKEWAYAGFTFTFIGAIWSHLASGQPKAVLMPALALVVLAISYACRPLERRVTLEYDVKVYRPVVKPVPHG